MTEVEIYLDFDRLPPGIGKLKEDKTKYVNEEDVDKIREWVCNKVAGHGSVCAVITGYASRYLNMVAVAELSTLANVSKIRWCQAGRPTTADD